MDFAISLSHSIQRLTAFTDFRKSVESRVNQVAEDAPALRGAVPQEKRPESVAKSQDAAGNRSSNQNELSEEERRQIEELAARDAEVRAHERAHARTGGQYTGLPSYEYTSGPDGRQYAVNGEVAIDTKAEDSPEATIQKMEIVIRAALAPAEPSAQDRAVAAAAKQAMAEAKAELQEKKRKESEGEGEGSSNVRSIHARAAAAYQAASFADAAWTRGSVFSIAA